MRSSPRVLSRAGALAVSAALIAVIYLGLVVPYREHARSIAARAEAAASLLERYRVLAAQGGASASGEDAGDAATLDGVLLPEISDAQATAQLQRLLQSFAAANGLEISGVQALPREDTPTLQRLSLRLRGAGEIGAINAFLYAAETARPLLVIDNLRLTARQTRGDPRLELQLDVTAFKARPSA